jgi:hypothetical protein
MSIDGLCYRAKRAECPTNFWFVVVAALADKK